MVFKTGCIIFGPSKSKMDMVIEALPMKKYVYCSKHLYLTQSNVCGSIL